MQFRLKNFSSMSILVCLSVILLAATSGFGQEQAPANNFPPPHFKPAPQLGNALNRPFAHPEAIVDQLKKLGEQQKPGWEKLLRALDFAINLLSGNETNLLSGNKPELLSKNKAALLSGNNPEILSKNNPKLLSGNKPKILSGNKTSLFSGNHFSFFSGLKIEVHIENAGNNNGNNSGNNSPSSHEDHEQFSDESPVPESQENAPNQ
jgi:hypothetical protein